MEGVDNKELELLWTHKAESGGQRGGSFPLAVGCTLSELSRGLLVLGVDRLERGH